MVRLAVAGGARPVIELSGIRIIDMTHNQAGPACAQILGFLGADVIKLEEPKGGDIARTNMRDMPDSDSLFFLILNANKRSLTRNPTCCWRISGPARWTGLAWDTTR